MADTKNNSGHYNSGHCNSGHRNSGNYNSGHRNSGHRNSGNYNSGHRNSGHRNSGNYNSGDCNSGHFCTQTPKPTFFDAPVDMTWEEADELIPYIDLPVGCRWVPESEMSDEEKQANANYKTIGGYLKVLHKDFKAAFSEAWPGLDDETKAKFMALPNFDAAKFLEITGVDVSAPAVVAASVPSEVVVDGRRYVLAD